MVTGKTLKIDASGHELKVELAPQGAAMRLGSLSELTPGQEVIAIGTLSRHGFILKRIVMAQKFRKIFLEGMGKWERMKCRWKVGTLTSIFPVKLRTDDADEELPLGTATRVFLPLDIKDIKPGDEIAAAGERTKEGLFKAVFILVGPGAREVLPPGPHALSP